MINLSYVALLRHAHGEESIGRNDFLMCCRTEDGGFVALRRRPAGGGVKSPQGALAEDCRAER
jgi:hypothetical protein